MALEQVGLQAVFLTGEFQRGMRIYQQNINVVNNITQETARQSERSGKEMASAWEANFKKIAKKAAVAVAAFVTVQKAVAFMKEATLLAARVETLGVALATVGKNAGYGEKEIAAFEEAVKAQGITTQAARQSLLMMGQAQIDFVHAAELARMAQDAAVIANMNSSQAFEHLVYVIQTGNIRMARTLGLQVSFQKGYERFAASIGKTTDELTEEEQVQARVNAVMAAGKQIAGTYEAAMGTAGKQALSLARHIEEITRAVGEIGLGAFSVGIQEITRLLVELREWMEENEEQLEDLGEAVAALAGAMVDLAGLDLPVEDLTAFVENLTTLVSVLAVGIEAVSNFRVENEGLAKILKGLGMVIAPVTIGFTIWDHTVGALIGKTTEFRKENEALFLTEKQIAENVSKFREPWVEIAEEQAAADARRAKAAEEAAEAAAAEAAKRKEMQEKVAEAMTKTLADIEDAQRDHNRKLADMADDYRHKQERAWEQYGVDVAKEIAKGRKKLADITLEYEKDVAEALEDYQDDQLAAEEDLNKSLLQAQQDYERRAAQDRERFELDQVQSERRYQYERARLVAEGDTLALEELDARYELEQKEAEENEKLRRKQAQETQDALVEAMEAAAREQAEALAEALAEQLKEMQEQSREEIIEQEQANKDRLDEMAAAFAEQQRLADEDYRTSLDKANRNYDRQQEDLGRNLARQEELQEVSGDEVAYILEQYYGPHGLNRKIMEGYYEWLEERAVVSAATVAAAMAMSASPSKTTSESYPEYEAMQRGGVLRGPAMAYVEPGVTEAFVPLTGPGAGGAFTHEFLNALRVAGLERGSPADVNAIAREMARSLTAKIRSRRRT